MALSTTELFLQYLAWTFALIEVVAGLYLLVLNYRHLANRMLSLFLLLVAANSYAIGWLVSFEGSLDLSASSSIANPMWVALVLVSTSAALLPILVLTTIAFFQPAWLGDGYGAPHDAWQYDEASLDDGQGMDLAPQQRLVSRRKRWLKRFIPSRATWIVLLVILLAVLPLVLSLVDIFFSPAFRYDAGYQPLYFTGFDTESYSRGSVMLSAYAGGRLALLITIVTTAIPFLMLVSFLAAVIFSIPKIFSDSFAQTASGGRGLQKIPQRRLAFFLLLILVLVGIERVLSTGFAGDIALDWVQRIHPVLLSLASTTLLAIAYALVGIIQIIQERRAQLGSLRLRLTALVLVATAPILIAIVAFISSQATVLIEQQAIANLRASHLVVSTSASDWLESTTRALRELAQQPDIISLDAQRQKPVLEAMASAYPEMYLVSTTNVRGFNIARNDQEAPKDYQDRDWYQSALRGSLLSYQVLIGRTSGVPALVVSTPIRNQDSAIIGVAMFASELTELAQTVQSGSIEQTGIAYVVDEVNRVVAHPDLTVVAELQDYSTYAPVFALRRIPAGTTQQFSFTDDHGIAWLSIISSLENGWGVVVQQTQEEVFSSLRLVQRVSFIILIVGLVFIILLAWFTVRQSLLPVGVLTETAQAIGEGDLNSLAVVTNQDELGFLADTFNRMTGQLRESIASLEQRVAERTLDLERRTAQVQAAAQVARDTVSSVASFGQRSATSGPIDGTMPDAQGSEEQTIRSLLFEIADLISQRLGFYHVGIFLLDESGKEAVLQATNSPGGQRMLARGHTLSVGRVGIVGYVAGSGKPRIALDVGDDAVFFNNPDLPETRSEMALPLKAGDQIIGVLDVQSKASSAFSQVDVDVLQVMADQIALALVNARLLEEYRRANQELSLVLGERTLQSWQKRLQASAQGALAFRYSPTGIYPVEPVSPSEISVTPENLTAPQVEIKDGYYELRVPILLREQPFGSITLRRAAPVADASADAPVVEVVDSEEERGRDASSGTLGWSQEEIGLVVDTLAQIVPALENARLLDETQAQAVREQAINQFVSDLANSLDLDTLLQVAVRELGNLPQVSEAAIRLGSMAQDIAPQQSLQSMDDEHDQ